jgi:adenine phosphoribosyltransferase
LNTAADILRIAGVANLRELIRDIADFPRPGVVFKDITPLLADPAGLALSVELMAQPLRGLQIDAIIGAESRGFIFGTAVATALSVGFIPVRKPGKLPAKTRRHDYDLEYGQDALELHEDAIGAGQRVVIVDDVLATGGTLEACCQLVTGLGADIVAIVVLIELTRLEGRKRVSKWPLSSVIQY